MEASLSPKPTALLNGISLVNIFVGGVIGSCALLAWDQWDPKFSTFAALVVVCLGATFSVVAYFATFRRSLLAAKAMIGISVPIYSLLSGCLTVSFVVSRLLSDGLAEQSTLEAERWIIWTLFAVPILGGLVAAWANWRWLRQLQEASPPVPEKTNPYSVSLVEIMGVCVLAAIIVAPASYRARTNPSLYLEDVTAAEAPFDAPDTAQAITYQRDRQGWVSASFTIDEAPLHQWLTLMSGEAVNLQEITKPRLVNLPDRRDPSAPPGGTSQKVSDGFRASWRQNDRYFIITYDRAQKTAFYQEVPVSE